MSFPISVSWTIAGILSIAGLLSILGIIVCICYCIKNKNKKKQQHHAFGISKKTYFKDRKPPARNPTPVSNPSKGHYLKKSPSPTGHKSPPGSVDAVEESQKRPLLHGQDVVDHQSESSMRRSSSGHIVESVCGSISSTDSNQILGTLHCTIRYSFEKNALVVTVNRCENLPAKDTAAKSR